MRFNAVAHNPANGALQLAQSVFDQLDVSEVTRANYSARINLFLHFAKDEGLQHDTFLRYKKTLSARSDYSVSTKNAYLAAARIFLRELHRQGLIPVDITISVKSFKQSKSHKRDGLNGAEMTALTVWLQQLEPTPFNMRLKAILSLLALQGLRQVELVRLNVSDVDLVRKVALVWGKGCDDTNPISLHPETVKIVKAYLESNGIADGPLFISRSNNSKGQRLTTKSVRMLVNSALCQARIEGRTTHGFRHYFTTQLVKAYQGDLLQVARYTRHQSLEMLQTYFDEANDESDLPRYYKTFEGLSF
jgi:integrase/recombinase XerC